MCTGRHRHLRYHPLAVPIDCLQRVTDGSTEATASPDLAEITRPLEAFIPKPLVAGTVPVGADGVGLVDPTTGIWHLHTHDGDPASFYCGSPGDFPMMGNWNGDGVSAPAVFRPQDTTPCPVAQGRGTSSAP